MKIFYYNYLQKLLQITALSFYIFPLFSISNNRELNKFCLSPKSTIFNETILLEKKEVFIKNTIHGSSSPFFTLSTAITGVSGNIQFIIYTIDNKKIFDEKFISYLNTKNSEFLNLYEEFKDMIVAHIFSDKVDIEKAWEIFKIISGKVRNASNEMKVRINDYLEKYNLKLENELNNKILNLIMSFSEQMSAIFEISIKCVENPEKLYEIFYIDDCINYLVKVSQKNYSYTDFKIEIDSNLRGYNRMILGNTILLNNVLENFLNNAMQHRNNKVRVKVFIDANEVVFAFENDAKHIPENVLEKVNGRERLFYLNYSTKGMGVGTTLAWYVANIFNHSIKVKNLQEGVLFEYRIPLLRIADAANLEKKFKNQFKFDETSQHLKIISEFISNSSVNAAA